MQESTVRWTFSGPQWKIVVTPSSCFSTVSSGGDEPKSSPFLKIRKAPSPFSSSIWPTGAKNSLLIA